MTLVKAAAALAAKRQPTDPKKPDHTKFERFTTATQRNVIVWGAIGAVAVGVGAIGYWRLRSAIAAAAAVKEQSKSFTRGTPSDWANRIRQALLNGGFWGTNVRMLRGVLREIPTRKDWEDTIDSYNIQSEGKVLPVQLEKELTPTEFNELQLIIDELPANANAPRIHDPYKWAQRLRFAFDYEFYPWLPWGTDEDAIKAVLSELESKQDWLDLQAAYTLEYSPGNPNALIEDLNSEVSSSDVDWQQITDNLT